MSFSCLLINPELFSIKAFSRSGISCKPLLILENFGISSSNFCCSSILSSTSFQALSFQQGSPLGTDLSLRMLSQGLTFLSFNLYRVRIAAVKESWQRCQALSIRQRAQRSFLELDLYIVTLSLAYSQTSIALQQLTQYLSLRYSQLTFTTNYLLSLRLITLASKDLIYYQL